MADEDNFDIDIYGDLDNEPTTTIAYKKENDDELLLDDVNDHKDVKQEQQSNEDTNMASSAENGDNSETNQTSAKIEDSPPVARKTQPVKRKFPDDRPIDQNATSALYVADLHWWTTDDDIRGWITKCECEDELKDITFSEHKVNGKSKGYALRFFALVFAENPRPLQPSLTLLVMNIVLSLSNSQTNKPQRRSKGTLKLSAASPPTSLNAIKSTLLPPLQTPSAPFRRMHRSARTPGEAVWAIARIPAAHKTCHRSTWASTTTWVARQSTIWRILDLWVVGSEAIAAAALAAVA